MQPTRQQPVWCCHPNASVQEGQRWQQPLRAPKRPSSNSPAALGALKWQAHASGRLTQVAGSSTVPPVLQGGRSGPAASHHCSSGSDLGLQLPITAAVGQIWACSFPSLPRGATTRPAVMHLMHEGISSGFWLQLWPPAHLRGTRTGGDSQTGAV
jgi:hypothetical protein